MDLELIARTSAVLIAGAALVAALRNAAPSTRHFVWHLSIVVVLLAPFLAPLAPSITVPLVPQVSQVPQDILANAVPGSELAAQQANAFGTLVTIATAGTVVVLSWFGLCWLLSGLSVWRGSIAAPELWLSEARALAKRMRLTSPIAVRQLRREASPHVAGFFASVVMMPPSAMSWTVDARQAALVHELTHIKRGDRRTQALAQLACAIYWFNPLVWRAAAGLSRERERACDDEVLRFGATPSAYATLLLDLARRPGAWRPAAALSMARPSAIEGRLISILAGAIRTPRRSTRWLAGSALITITTAILGAQAAAPPPARPRALAAPVLMMDDRAAAPSVTRALVQALGDTDRQVREQAAIGLAVTPGTDVIDPLLGALKDPDAQVREKAAIGLAFRRDPKIVEPLLTALADADSQVREKAAIALGASGDARAVGALTNAMQDPDSQVREKAVAGLVLLGFRRSTGAKEQ